LITFGSAMIDSGTQSRKYCKPWNGYGLVSHKWLLISTVPRIPVLAIVFNLIPVKEGDGSTSFYDWLYWHITFFTPSSEILMGLWHSH
jgi:hypothetical protein